MRYSDSYTSDQSAESKIVAILLGVSVAAHLVILFADSSFLFSDSKIYPDETVITADILPDMDLGAATQDALPQVKQAEELKVEEKILPQLPTKFKIEEKAPEKDEMAIAEEEKPKPKVKKETKKKAKEIQVVKKQQKDATELRKKDALARLLKEQARKEKKFAKETVAPLSKKLAQRKMELAENNGGASGGGGLSEIRRNKYANALQRAIRRNYSLPEVYNLANAKLRTEIRMILNASGDLRKLEIAVSSGDASFDQLALKTIQNSVPLPRPPTFLAGKSFTFIFSPNTM